MIRRRSILVVALAAILGSAGIAGAAKVPPTYQLVNTNPNGSPAITEVIASITPAGSVAPPSADVSPFTVQPGSSGFNPDNLTNFLGDGTLNTGDPLQVLRLQFDSKGFGGKGATLNFALNLDPKYTGPHPTLTLAPGTTGLFLSYTGPADNQPAGGGTTPAPITTPTTNQVPEPISIVLWSAVAGFGLIRARAFRRVRTLDI